MPNEALLEQLDGLREKYSAQQKATGALQAAFKAVGDAHNKAQRSLRDFRAQNGAVAVEPAQQAFTDTRLKETVIDPLLPDLRREAKTLATLTGALKDAATALRTEPVDVVRLDKAVAALQATRQTDVAALLPDLRGELDLAQRALGDEFGQKLRAALAEQGTTIGGRAPKFVIGRFELEANFAKRFLILRYGRDVVVPRIPITVEATIRAYQGAAKLIAGRNTDGKVWMAQFREAYGIARRKREINGTRVNIVDCYLELVLLRQSRTFAGEPSKHNFTDYLRAQFIYDFYEFTSGRLTDNGWGVRGHVATKSQADKPALSMWIVDGGSPYDGRYVADIEFVKE